MTELSAHLTSLGSGPPLICRLIQLAREQADLSQAVMAERLGLSRKGYAAYEHHRQPRPRRLEQIAAALGKPISFFSSNSEELQLLRHQQLLDQLLALKAEMQQLRHELTLQQQRAHATKPQD